jgi:hypothetical protein
MEDSRFCVICGGPFDVVGDVYNIDPKDMRFQVNSPFREALQAADTAHIHSGYLAFVFLVASQMYLNIR